MLNKKSLLAASILPYLIGEGLTAPRVYYASGTCSLQFDYGNIYQARRKNRRNKMQIRRSGMGVK